MRSHTQHLKRRQRPAANQQGAAGLPKHHNSLALSAVILALFVAVLSISGCVGLTSAGSLNKPGSNSTTAGVLAPNTTSVDFGNVAIGSKSSQTLTLTNSGAAAVTISQATVSGPGFSLSGSTGAVSIAPGTSHAIQVAFAPAAAGSSSGALVLASDATNPSLTLSLTGNAMANSSIKKQPANQSVLAGQTATFDVVATGSGVLAYQWSKNGTPVSGATSPTYTTPPTTLSDNGASFTVTLSDATGAFNSTPAVLTVTTTSVAPTITMQPASSTVTSGQTATFAVTATGTATLTYQWSKNGSAIGGATSASYTTPATTTSDSGASFSVTVGNSSGSVTSSAATLTVSAATLLLNASTTSLDFTSVTIGSSGSLGVTFTNAGNADVTIFGVTIAGAGFAASGVSTGQILAPGQTAALSVTFTPSATGSVTGSVTVASNATNSPAKVTLSGTGAPAVSHSATLNWVASTSAVAGYNIYRSNVSGGTYTKLNSQLITSPQYTDSTVLAAQTYYYVVTSETSGGVESVFSNEATAIIP